MTRANPSRVTGVAPDLTERESALLTLVAGCIGATGLQPTYRQIQKAMGYKSTNSVAGIIHQLLMKGVVWETTGHGIAFDWKAYRGEET